MFLFPVYREDYMSGLGTDVLITGARLICILSHQLPDSYGGRWYRRQYINGGHHRFYDQERILFWYREVTSYDCCSASGRWLLYVPQSLPLYHRS